MLPSTRGDEAVRAPSSRQAAGVSVRNLGKAFGTRRVIGGLDLNVPAGEIVAVLGRSGCGKTTLLRVLGGLDRDFTGEVQTPGRVAIVYQESRLLPWRRVWQNVVIGLRNSQRRQAADAALAEVDLGDRGMAWPNVLSGGEGARVALARAFVREPELLLLDEPFAALDALTRIKMHGLLMQLWHRHHPAIVMVTHDVDEAVLLADRVVVMTDGRIGADIAIASDRPRSRVDSTFQELRAALLSDLGVDERV